METMKQYFNTNLEKVKVPEDHLFVIGDTWWRSLGSDIYGPLPIREVIGLVEGYEK